MLGGGNFGEVNLYSYTYVYLEVKTLEN